jgi:hypothetical protein
VNCDACRGSGLARLPRSDEEIVALWMSGDRRRLRTVIESLGLTREHLEECLPGPETDQRIRRIAAAIAQIEGTIANLEEPAAAEAER